MEQDFVTYDLAVKLKEKGFREKCIARHFPARSRPELSYDPKKMYIDVPAIFQVLRWLREKNIHMIIDIDEEGWFFYLRCLRKGFLMGCEQHGYSKTYEQAAIAGIIWVLDNLI